MQKILNLIFIIALTVIAMTMPLNTSFLDFQIFKPITDPTEPSEPGIIENIDFVGIKGCKLAGTGDRDVAYWTAASPENHFIAQIDREDDFFDLVFSSNTSEYSAEFPAVSVVIDGGKEYMISPIVSGAAGVSAAGDSDGEGGIVIENLDILEDGTAVYNFRFKDIYTELSDGYHVGTLKVGGSACGRIIFSKNAIIKKQLLGYGTEIPINQKVVWHFFPDADYRELIMVPRFQPKELVDYIGLYNSLRAGSKTELGLCGSPAIAYSDDYWIANNEVRVAFYTKALEEVSAISKNRELMYTAFAYTFEAYGQLQNCVVVLDGKPEQEVRAPAPPFFYLPYENSSERILIRREEATIDADETPAEQCSRVVSAYADFMHKNNVLSPAVVLTNCDLSEDGQLTITFKNYEYIENQEIFELLLNLTAYSCKNVKALSLNGRALDRVILFNMEE